MDTPNTGQAEQVPQQPFVGTQPIPNSVAVLVLGILSIVFCWCYGVIGLILGIIALVLAGKAKGLYNANPEIYSLGSYKNLKAGRICGIIGISLSALYLIFIILYFLILGTAMLGMPWEEMMRH